MAARVPLKVDMIVTDKGTRVIGNFGQTVDREFKSASQAAEGFSTKLTSMQSTVAKIAGGIGLGLLAKSAVDVGKDFIDMASDMEETLSKSNTIFGASAGEIRKWADSAATSMGMSSQAALENAATLGNMFSQLGAGTDAAAKNSKAMVGLAADLASFHNVAGGAEAVLQGMQSAFRGEYDALQRYIPTINAAAVQQQALAATGKKSAKELTDLEKATAAMKIIMHDAGAATGDFLKTWGGAANQGRILEAQIGNIKAKIGESLLPFYTKAILATNNWIQENDDLIKQRVPEYLSHIADGLGSIIDYAKGMDAGSFGYGALGWILYGPAGGAWFFDLSNRINKINEELEKTGKIPAPTEEHTLIGWMKKLFGSHEIEAIGDQAKKTIEQVRQSWSDWRDEYEKLNAQMVTEDEKNTNKHIQMAQRLSKELKFASVMWATDWTEAYGLMNSEIRQLDETSSDVVKNYKDAAEDIAGISEDTNRALLDRNDTFLSDMTTAYDGFIGDIRSRMRSGFEDIFLGIAVDWEGLIKQMGARLAAEQFTMMVMPQQAGAYGSTAYQATGGAASGFFGSPASSLVRSGASYIGQQFLPSGITTALGTPVIGATAPTFIGEVTGSVGGASALGASPLAGLTWGGVLGIAGAVAGVALMIALSQKKTRYGEVGPVDLTYNPQEGFDFPGFPVISDYGMGSAMKDALDTYVGTITDQYQNVFDRLAKAMPEYAPLDFEKLGDISQHLGNTYKSGFEGFSVSEKGDPQAEIQKIIQFLSDRFTWLADDFAEALGSESWDALLETLAKWEKAMKDSAATIAPAFKTGIESGDWQDFESALYDSIYNQVLDGFVEAMMQTEVFQRALQPFFIGYADALDQSLKDGVFNVTNFKTMMDPLFSSLEGEIDRLQPLFDVSSGYFSELKDSFTASAKGLDTVVEGYYRDLLGRSEGDYTKEEITGWSNSGLTTEEIKQGIKASKEYIDLHGADAGDISRGAAYIARYEDLRAAYEKDPRGLTPDKWALEHYNEYGRVEDRSYATGLDFVPFDMPVKVHRKEAILNPEEADRWRSGRRGGDTRVSIEFRDPAMEWLGRFVTVRSENARIRAERRGAPLRRQYR